MNATTGVGALDASLQRTQVWLNALCEETGWDDPQRAYQALRATLQALRDSLPMDEAAQLGAQLPLIIRGIFFEGWNPHRSPLRPSRHEFLQRIRGLLRGDPDAEPEFVARSVFRVLVRFIDQGESIDIVRLLPLDIRELWDLDYARRRKRG